MDFLKTLNEPQKQAVTTTRGRILVLAGAGSGKTRVITYRVAYLIATGVPPESILCLTFTNKAAKEMRDRVKTLIGSDQGSKVTLSTFHSFCLHLLRKEAEKLGFTKDFSLYDERDIERLIQQIVRDMLGHVGELPSLGPIRAALTQASCHGSWDDKALPKDLFSKELFHRLQATLRAYNAVSFDTLISLALRLFNEHPDVVSKYQHQFQYVMIDEYQDTNHSQYQLVERLVASHNQLCVVGDDDQSIYGWRGAKVRHIVEFQADCVIKLEQNYRSTSVILDAANALIGHNTSRVGKKLWSKKRSEKGIEVFTAPTDIDEAQGIITRLLAKKEALGLAWKDIAILYRSNALSRNLELALMQAPWKSDKGWIRGIPYEIFGGLEFSERSEIKDLFAYLRVIANPLDQEALLRIANVPRRGVSDLLLDKVTQENRLEKRPLWDLFLEIASGKKTYPEHTKGMSGIRQLVELIETATRRFAVGSLADSLHWLVETIHYKKAIEEEVKSEAMRAYKWENIQECITALRRFEEAEGARLQQFVTEVALATQTHLPSDKKGQTDAVQLMTLHSAKGLEFPLVFIAALEDHLLPHEKSVVETGVEEERRLFYVGLTRAEKEVVLSMARSRMRMGKIEPSSPSRFLFEIPKALLEVTPWR
ncbi:MAG: hypothetical protein RL235_1090 [Chlamydiota bacterium]